MANQPNIVMDKQRKTAILIDLAILSYSNIGKKEHQKHQKCQEMRGLKNMSSVKEGYSDPSYN